MNCESSGWKSFDASRDYFAYSEILHRGCPRKAGLALLQRRLLCLFARNSVVDANPVNIRSGEDPAAVASVVLEALTSQSPRLRYTAGSQARLASRLRKFVPASLFDRGLRKQFGLITA
jgi:hypothetical protein